MRICAIRRNVAYIDFIKLAYIKKLWEKTIPSCSNLSGP